MKSSLDFLLSSPLFDFHKIIQFRLRLVNRIFFYFFFLRKSQGHRTTSTIRAEGEITSNSRRWKIFLLLYFIAHRTRLRRRRIELYNVCLRCTWDTNFSHFFVSSKVFPAQNEMEKSWERWSEHEKIFQLNDWNLFIIFASSSTQKTPMINNIFTFSSPNCLHSALLISRMSYNCFSPFNQQQQWQNWFHNMFHSLFHLQKTCHCAHIEFIDENLFWL